MEHGDPSKRKIVKRTILSKLVLINSLKSCHTGQSKRCVALFGGVSSPVVLSVFVTASQQKICILKNKENSIPSCFHEFSGANYYTSIVSTLWWVFSSFYSDITLIKFLEGLKTQQE